MSRTLQMPGDFSIRTQPVRGTGEPHAHDFLELAYIRSGWAQHTVNGRTRRLEAGDFVLIDFGEVHSYDLAGEGLTVVNCLFQPAAVDPSLSRCRSFRTLLSSCMIGVGYAYAGIGPFEKIFHDGEGRILGILERLEEEFRCREVGYYPLIRVLLVDLIVQTMRMIRERAPAPSGMEVSWILDELRRDPAAPHSLSDYAARFHMRPEALSRLFRKQAGEGFAACLRKSRVELACRLLLETDAPVPEIAERCGYLDGKTFREAFKTVTGLCPRAYRTRGRTGR
ncbi:MAG TPA: helix-turn-helix domain-containing protein [Candidatus Merdivicinus faecavium]|nr:helix-turn-helix domain-containing protein [Candidatus Merdivicinus faecavium]